MVEYIRIWHVLNIKQKYSEYSLNGETANFSDSDAQLPEHISDFWKPI